MSATFVVINEYSLVEVIKVIQAGAEMGEPNFK